MRVAYITFSYLYRKGDNSRTKKKGSNIEKSSLVTATQEPRELVVIGLKKEDVVDPFMVIYICDFTESRNELYQNLICCIAR